MKNRFLLFAGDNYYPSGGSNDLHGIYETEKEARNVMEDLMESQYPPDWYEIFDVQENVQIEVTSRRGYRG